MRAVANAVSVLLHPLFMPLYTLALLMTADPHVAYFLPEQAKWITLMMVAVMTVAFPLTSTLLLLRTGMISGLSMPLRAERIAPLIMTLIYLAATTYLLVRSPLHPITASVFSGMVVAVFLTTIATIRWKISLHMVGIGGLLAAMAGAALVHSLDLFPLIVTVILCAGLLGTARLVAGQHRHSEIYSGFVVGALPVYACVSLGLSF